MIGENTWRKNAFQSNGDRHSTEMPNHLFLKFPKKTRSQMRKVFLFTEHQSLLTKPYPFAAIFFFEWQKQKQVHMGCVYPSMQWGRQGALHAGQEGGVNWVVRILLESIPVEYFLCL